MDQVVTMKTNEGDDFTFRSLLQKKDMYRALRGVLVE